MATEMERNDRLTGLERLLLLVPAAGGAVFGLFPFLLGGAFGKLFGAPGNDDFIYRVAGAATFGYPFALLLGIQEGRWLPLRLVVVATFIFNLGSLYACAAAIVSGTAIPIVYIILVTSILIMGITAALWYRHRDVPIPPPDTGPLLRWFTLVAMVLGALTGLLALFVPQVLRVFGFQVTDPFLYGQAGAATLGYVATGFFILRDRAWVETRLTAVMNSVFNALAFLDALVTILAGQVNLAVLVVGAVGLGASIGSYLLLRRGGR